MCVVIAITSRDPWLALLEYRNTPVETIGSSLAQRFMSQRTKTLINANNLNPLCPQVVEGVEKKIELKRQKAKSYHNRSAHPLPQLEAGQEVRVAPLKRGQSWQAGTLVEKLSHRSYLMKTGSENIRQNRHLRISVRNSQYPIVPRKCPQKLPKNSLLLPLLIEKETTQAYLIQYSVPLLMLCLISLLILCLQCPQSTPISE